MVFTVGCLNILLFGAVEFAAGYVLSSLANDVAARNGIPLGSKPCIACVFWAILLYLWMLLIAYAYQQWKNNRLDQETDLNVAYWFSYISTTTIGLGDLYLDPEVLITPDLFTFPILFLVSFSLFGSFLAELGSALYNPFENRGTLVDILRETDIFTTDTSPLESTEELTNESTMSERVDDTTQQTNHGPVNAVETVATGFWKAEALGCSFALPRRGC